MNDPSNLELYSRLVRFQAHISQEYIAFDSPDKSRQRTLHSFAHGLGLEYEYSRATKEVRITHAESVVFEPNLDASIDNSSTVTCSGVTEPVVQFPELAPDSAVIQGDRPFADSHDFLAELDFLSSNSPWNFSECLAEQNQLSAPQFSAAAVVSQGQGSHSGSLPTQHGLEKEDLEILGTSSNIERNQEHYKGHDHHLSKNTQRSTSFANESLPVHFSDSSVHASSETNHTRDSWNHTPIDSNSMSGRSVNLEAPALQESKQDPLKTPISAEYDDDPKSPPAHMGPIELFIVRKALANMQHQFANSSPSPYKSQGELSSPKSVVYNASPKSPYYASGRQSPTRIGRASPSNSNTSPDRSNSPGRQGPLNSIVYATMKAVKVVGACWRCKILRKSCNPEKPCLMCPKRDLESSWAAVGCRRGTLKSEMLSFSLCPMTAIPATNYSLPNPTSLHVNVSWFLNIERRTEVLKSDASITAEASELNVLLMDLESRSLVVRGLRNRDHRSNLNLPAFLDVLDDCILAVMYEIYDCPSANSLFGESAGDMVVLLRSAALYWTETKPGSSRESEFLIPQSFDCLRVCLEALKLNISRPNHSDCVPSHCRIASISNITQQVDQYLDELSRVMFLKENMSQKSCWLSIFYSLCIQGYVRKVLVELAKTGLDNCLDETNTTDKATCNFKQYLHLASRLFIAASSTYDPLLPDYLPNLAEPTEDGDVLKTYRIAQEAVGRDRWSSMGILNSAEYLTRIFEDAGDELGVEAYPYQTPLPVLPASNLYSIDSISNPQIGGFICTYPGCTAQPFQTQYLLNSHANVHSTSRPYYCPIEGCCRSEGGKGFKRKNEMIRHGLVHDCPGYICPFCPDREHKYPRPDNLQRHVRIYHAEKDKDDPKLREVLSQRSSGSSRGRRRKEGPS